MLVIIIIILSGIGLIACVNEFKSEVGFNFFKFSFSSPNLLSEPRKERIGSCNDVYICVVFFCNTISRKKKI